MIQKINKFKYTAAVIALAAGLSACGEKAEQKGAQSSGDKAVEQTQQQSENKRIAQFFEDSFKRQMALSPIAAMRLGIKGYESDWGDFSVAGEAADLALAKTLLAELKEFKYQSLNQQNQLNYDLFKMTMERSIDRYQWRDHDYPINQMFGTHSFIPTHMLNVMRIKTAEDAENYLKKLSGVEKLLADVTAGLKRRASKGVMPPKFVFPMVIQSTENILKGQPFTTEGADNLLLADFKKKIAKAKLDNSDDLIARAVEILSGPYKRGYDGLLAELKAQASVATTDDGVWKLPDGDAYYKANLAMHTTTDLTADEVHNIGLKHVERIHNEMKDIMKKVGFKGSLKEFFEYTRTDAKFYYPNTDEGRQAYLKEATAMIDRMQAKAPEYFDLMPKAKLEVRKVEAFREKAAGKAFYQGPSLDGSRPGYYYANLYDMAAMPIYQMEALAYHEGVPGHHFQIAIAQELPDVPMFRRLSRFTAYSEGWGLYTEELGKDMGFYTDPYSDFGRLAMELWRACRLVVDTGMHQKRWTREQAIDYLMENTPNPKSDVVKAIERYIVMPGQATAYMIGKLKIMELRTMAMKELGDQFDWRGFHRAVLENGIIPLSMLEENVKNWIETVKK